MPVISRARRGGRNKVSKACNRCRLLKARCSGTQPCNRCERRNESCHYAVEEKRVTITESYLRELQGRTGVIQPLSGSDIDVDGGTAFRDDQNTNHASYQQTIPTPSVAQASLSVANDSRGRECDATGRPSSSSTAARRSLSRGEALAHALGNFDSESGFGQNPLASEDYAFAAAAGRCWYMAPISSWSFCRRVLALLGKCIPEADGDQWHRQDKGAYNMQWKPLGPNEEVDISNLPHRDHTLFLIGAAKFYLNNYLGLIDEPEFTKGVYELYEGPAEKANSSRTWYAHFLLVLAYGKAYSKGNNSKGPPGSHYALRAMTMLPDMSGLYADPVLAVQTLTLASMWFQSVDMRIAAYYHISQAMRTCIMEGMHRHMPEQIVGAKQSKRACVAFWAIYTMEKEFSSSIGAPSALQDEAITAKPPSQMNSSVDAVNMELHVRLTRLTARILSTVYGVGRQFDNTLIPNTQSILRELAELSRDLTDVLRTHFPGTFSKASRMAHRLVISYHHCVVLSTRPLVMCALQMHVENSDTFPPVVVPLTSTVASLLSSCVESAHTILNMLRSLDEEGLLDSFLPFQLDAAYSSAFILHLIKLISPSLLQDQSWPHDIEYIFDRMIASGSVVAPVRKLELQQLENAMAALIPSTEQSWGLAPRAGYVQEQNFATDDYFRDPFWHTIASNGVSGLLPQEILDLADRLDVEDVASTSSQ